MNNSLRFFSLLLFVATLVPSTTLLSQTFTVEEKTQGYAVREDQTIFLYDPETYGNIPNKVVVTGEFRNWDQNMENEAWIMHKKADYWELTVNNPNYNVIKPQSKFKFRIDNGAWQDPPDNAPNRSGGDLVFLYDFEIESISAELMGPLTIWAKVEGSRSLNEDDYLIRDNDGNEIKVAKVLPNTYSDILIVPEKQLDIKRVYYLEVPSKNQKALCSFDGWFRHLYSDKELGANISQDGKSTTIRVFAPRAEKVVVYLYENAEDGKEYEKAELTQDSQGVWEITFNLNLKGVYYDFTVHGSTDKGNHFYETDPVHISDPYARVSINTWGKSRIWEKTTPATPLSNGIPEMQDLIAYEVHIQDFTDLLPVDETKRSRIPAMVETGLKNSNGESIGFDYLVNLGINTVHLMPMQEYLHFPDDDWKESFQNDEYMIDQGVSEENYQWGYRTTHAFAVEYKYRQLGMEPGEERNQFRDLVQAFHDKGLAVIIDIVPNHTGENMDGNHWNFNFNALDKQYYYRTRELEHIGEYGNEVKTENRPMVQRWLIDQCLHWIEEFGIDGFRIDLAGQIDEQTLIKLKDAIGHDKILYGEPWIGSNDPAYEANPDWDWYKEDSPITFFNDDSRNAFKGPVFELNTKEADRGWPGGKFDERENVKLGLANKFPAEKSPLSGINYLDIHDNFALADQFGTTEFDGRFGVDEDRYKIAVTLLYTSLGPIVTHGGSEIMRSKGHAPLMEVVKETNGGIKVYMHGKRDTYNHRTANQFIWENVGLNKGEKGSSANYKEMYEFWRGMNLFRRSEYGKSLRVAQPVADNYYRWIEPANNALLGYTINDEILVLLNASDKEHSFNTHDLPDGTWKLIGNNVTVDHVKGIRDSDKSIMKLKGGQSHSITVPAQGLKIWVKQ